MKLIFGFDKLIKQMIQMIESADKQVFILSFELDLTYKKYDLLGTIERAIKRGIKFYIITSNLSISAPQTKIDSEVALRRLKIKYPESVFVKLNYYTDENRLFISPYVNYLSIFNKSFYNVSPSGIHARYMYNGRDILVSGGVYSQRFLDNPHYETGLFVSNVTINMERVFNDIYAYKLPKPFTMSGNEMYHYIVYNIQHCERRIYIENQYFMSNPEDTQNRICDALIERIGSAIRHKEDFRCDIITNWDCKDETKFRQDITGYYMKKSLKYLLVSLHGQFPMESINKYLYVYISDSTLIHSKIFMFDNKDCLFTTANVYDASFYSRGQLEIGYFIKDERKVCRNIRRGLRKSVVDLTRMSNQFIYDYKLNHMFNIPYLKELTFICAPIHTEFDNGVYKCDNMCYDYIGKNKLFIYNNHN